jgi:hypothetical protein
MLAVIDKVLVSWTNACAVFSELAYVDINAYRCAKL